MNRTKNPSSSPASLNFLNRILDTQAKNHQHGRANTDLDAIQELCILAESCQRLANVWPTESILEDAGRTQCKQPCQPDRNVPNSEKKA